ncbi:MAG TPA: hypothetical protein VKU94_01430, partial [Geobacterales bacterium]|nr:hypothetical protein [Geobacterales bacterium]
GLIPLGYDPFVITDRPDIFICGHFNAATHGSYHGCLFLSNSSWINYIEDEEPTHSCYIFNLKDLSAKRFLF